MPDSTKPAEKSNDIEMSLSLQLPDLKRIMDVN
jgi:hypothetical protein